MKYRNKNIFHASPYLLFSGSSSIQTNLLSNSPPMLFSSSMKSVVISFIILHARNVSEKPNIVLFFSVSSTMCKHIIMKWKINESLFTASAAFSSSSVHIHSSLHSLFNHHVLINLTSISIHLCINKNHELCCGLSYNLSHELLLVSFIHT